MVKRGKFFRLEFVIAFLFFVTGWLFCVLSRKAAFKLDNYLDNLLQKIKNGEKGVEGEEVVEKELSSILDERDYKIYKNRKLPGFNFDFDFLVVGPKGVVFLEVKNYDSQLLFSSEGTFQVKNLGLKKETTRLLGRNNPRQQLKYHAGLLAEYLRLNGFGNVSIRKALVFVKSGLVSFDEKVGVYVVDGVGELKRFFDNLYEDGGLTSEERSRLVDFLDANLKY